MEYLHSDPTPHSKFERLSRKPKENYLNSLNRLIDPVEEYIKRLNYIDPTEQLSEDHKTQSLSRRMRSSILGPIEEIAINSGRKDDRSLKNENEPYENKMQRDISTLEYKAQMIQGKLNKTVKEVGELNKQKSQMMLEQDWSHIFDGLMKHRYNQMADNPNLKTRGSRVTDKRRDSLLKNARLMV